jgi:hypothetical protein
VELSVSWQIRHGRGILQRLTTVRMDGRRDLRWRRPQCNY